MNPTTPSSSSSSAWELWESAKRVAASRGVFSAGQNRPPKSWFPQQPQQQQPPSSSSAKKRRQITTTTAAADVADGKENAKESATLQLVYSKRRKTLSALNSCGQDWKSIVNGSGTKDELGTLRKEQEQPPPSSLSAKKRRLSTTTTAATIDVTDADGKDELGTLREENARLRKENAMLRRQVEELTKGGKGPVV